MPDASVKVICRFRPVNQRELSEGERENAPQLEFPDDQTVIVKMANMSPQTYQFDRVFWNTETKQKDIYEISAKATIEDIFEGYNGTIFAYGQTGAGKSFTMFGPDSSDEELKGIIPRSCEHIFNKIASDDKGTEYILKCSFLEIYKESIRDLLDPNRTNLKVRETPSRGVWVQDLTEHFVTCVDDIYYLLQLGEKSRAVSSTKMNLVSSRSHSLFIITLSQKNEDGSTKEGKLNLADLAGSEKVGKTGATGETLEEAKKINQSLSALGNCINALTKSKKGHIPYRDSRLTHILRESLGGNSKTTLIIACSPHSFNIDETISTLKFGQRAKSIKNKVKINQQRSVKELEGIIENLTKELTNIKLYVKTLEDTIINNFDSNFDFSTLKKNITEHLKQKNDETQQSTPTKDKIKNEDDDIFLDPMNIAEMKVKMEQLKEKYELQILDLKEELESSNIKEIEKYKQEIESLKSALENEKYKSRLRQAKFDYESQMKDHETKIQGYEMNKKALEERINQLTDYNEALTKEKESILNDYNQLNQNFESLKNELNEKSHLLDENDSIISSLKEENNNLLNKVKKTKELVSELENKNETLLNELNNVKIKLKETENSLEKKNYEIELLESSAKERDNQESSIEKLKEQLLEEKKKNIHLNSDIRRRENDNKDLIEQLTQTKQSLLEEKEKANNLEESLEFCKIEFNEKEKEYRDQIRSLKESLQKESRMNDVHENEIKKLKKKLAEKDAKLRRIMKSMEESQNEFISKNETMTNQLANANKRIQELEIELEGAVEAYVIMMNNKLAQDMVNYSNNERQISSNNSPRDGGSNSPRNNNSYVPKSNIAIPLKGGQSNSIIVTPEKRQYMFFFKKTVYPSIEQLTSPAKTGSLYKQSGIFGFLSKKWFLLKGHYLYYFDSKESNVPSGGYHIANCIVNALDHDGEGYPFSLELEDKKQIFLVAELEKERISWMNTIMSLSALTEAEAIEYNATKKKKPSSTKKVKKKKKDDNNTNNNNNPVK